MRHYQIGQGPDGKSMVTISKEVDLAGHGPGTAVERFGVYPAAMFATPLGEEPAGSNFYRIDVADGDMRWTAFRMAPEHVSEMHHTDTFDFNIVIEGETNVLLGNGEVHLRPGDTILMTGGEHQWRAGPEGCTLVSVVRSVRRNGQR